MYKQVSRNTMPLNRTVAAAHAALPQFKGDRSRESARGRHRMAWLEERLREGKFHDPTWARARINGTCYKMDGGHSASMLSNTTLDIPTDLCVTILDFDCETQQDLADLFDQFDARNSIRTSIEKTNAHARVEPELDEISPTDINCAIRGIATALWRCGEYERLDEDARISLIHDHTDFIRWAAPFVRVRHLRRTGIVAAMFDTYARNRNDATEFWVSVRDENHPDNKNATRRLAVFLRDSVGGAKTGRHPWGTRAIYVKCCHAWNAWKGGDSTALKYHPNAPLPRLA